MTTTRERLITFVTLAGLTVAFVAAVRLPGGKAEAALRAEIAEAEARIARGPQALEQFRAARRELGRRREYLDRTAAAVGGPDDLLARISRIAQASDLTVVRLEPEPVRVRASYTEHPFRLDFRGDIGRLSDFLRGLEQDGRLYAVTDLNVLKSPDRRSGANLEGRLLFAAFAMNDGPAGFAEGNGSPRPH